jgi:hypothetical protein
MLYLIFLNLLRVYWVCPTLSLEQSYTKLKAFRLLKCKNFEPQTVKMLFKCQKGDYTTCKSYSISVLSDKRLMYNLNITLLNWRISQVNYNLFNTATQPLQ